MTEGILGGFIGSILTVLIARICDLIQKRNEHNYSLKKAFFDRKLPVAEAAISQRYLLISSLMNFLAVLDVISNNMHLVGSAPPEFLQRMIDDTNKKAEFLSGPLNVANASALYFDADNNLDIAAMKELMGLLISIDAGSKNVQIILVAQSQENDPIKKEKLNEIGVEILLKLREDIKKLSSKIEEGCQDLIKKVAAIRGEMKKFES
jgi:hypothetical protein